MGSSDAEVLAQDSGLCIDHLELTEFCVVLPRTDIGTKLRTFIRRTMTAIKVSRYVDEQQASMELSQCTRWLYMSMRTFLQG